MYSTTLAPYTQITILQKTHQDQLYIRYSLAHKFIDGGNSLVQCSRRHACFFLREILAFFEAGWRFSASTKAPPGAWFAFGAGGTTWSRLSQYESPSTRWPTAPGHTHNGWFFWFWVIIRLCIVVLVVSIDVKGPLVPFLHHPTVSSHDRRYSCDNFERASNSSNCAACFSLPTSRCRRYGTVSPWGSGNNVLQPANMDFDVRLGEVGEKPNIRFDIWKVLPNTEFNICTFLEPPKIQRTVFQRTVFQPTNIKFNIWKAFPNIKFNICILVNPPQIQRTVFPPILIWTAQGASRPSESDCLSWPFGSLCVMTTSVND